MPAKKAVRNPKAASKATAANYRHPTADLASRPEVGAQSHFKKSKPAAKYQFDSSLSPALDWDGQNPARETAERLIAEIADCGLRIAELAKQSDSPERDKAIQSLQSAIRDGKRRLAALSGPFLNWTGKAERLSFEVPTLPLFVHERLSTKAILETLKSHKRDRQDDFLDSLFAFQERPLHDQILRAYEFRDNWVNRMMLGDSLVAMNSLLRYESLGGQVQMIYLDPPYGVRFGSNFQPFIRKRDVAHNDDEDMTREPEMVQAYRDTWELGLHSYLTYLRDRLLLTRDLLHPSGSIFVQISDENLHHVREVMDEVFGAENFVSVITFVKTSAQEADELPSVCDYLVWYAKDRERLKFRGLYESKDNEEYDRIELPEASRRKMTKEERENANLLPPGAKPYRQDNIVSQRPPGDFPVEFEGEVYRPITGYWKTGQEGMKALIQARRIEKRGKMLSYVRFFGDFPLKIISNFWPDVRFSSRSEDKLYVVQTAVRVIERCLLMTTDPGDLVLDPTCGSGTTAYVAEQWGRRWISMDTSRVPLALARQRLLTATFPYYELNDEERGPAGGFVYKRKQNSKGDETGGIVPHITLKSIANNEPPAEEVLVDRPEVVRGVTRVTGPFVFEATIPTAEGLDEEPETPGIQSVEYQTHVERMIDVLRRAPVLRLPGNQSVTLKQIRPPAKTLALSAEAVIDQPTLANLGDDADTQPGLDREAEPVAIVFGPENGSITRRFAEEAWREAEVKRYARLFVIGFAIEPMAREFIENAAKIGMPAVYLQATMDLQMGDLLKNMRSSHVFSVCGLPDVKVSEIRNPKSEIRNGVLWQVELLGLDTFDPATMEPDHLPGEATPAWFLDTDYNGLVFRVCQAFFPRTGAWENLKKSLKVEFEDTVWDHLAGTVSGPFAEGKHSQIAVKVIDPRGNELMVVKKLEEAK
ncbi:MAG: site-specific DNA-methyltransferase [Verrucomicrobiales bacterium]